jgi:hypothetical protein
MPAVTGTDICEDAFAELNVFLPGEAMPPADGAKALRRLNLMLSGWAQRVGFIPFISRNRFSLTAGKGGTTNPYTIGPGGDFNVTRPSNQDSIVSANLILTASVPNVRVPLGIYTDDAYNANAIPDLQNSQPTGLYYSPTFVNDLGSVRLWPVPTINTNDLELFLQEAVAQFANLSTSYYVPDGWPEALMYGLARRLQTPYGKQLSPESKLLAISTESAIKRTNWARLSDLMNDASQFADNRATAYNILTGGGGA